MKTDILKVMAIFMSCLVISISFYSSGALAAGAGTVNVVSVKGKDSAEGARAMQNDYIDVIASVLASSEVATSDVHLVYAGSPSFETFATCSVAEPPYGYNCNYRSSADTRYAGIYPFHVCLSSAAGTGGCCSPDCSSCSEPRCRATQQLYIDGYPPVIKSFDINPKNTNGQSLTATYNVEDRLCAASACAGKCSGIKKIELIDLGTGSIVEDENINLGKDSCIKSGTINFSMTSVPDGVRQICIKAYDMLNQPNDPSANCIDIKKDSKAPVIAAADIFDVNGATQLRYVKPGGTEARIIVNVTSSAHFGMREAAADLSELGIAKQYLACIGSAGSYSCQKPVMIPAAASGNMVVDVADEGGSKTSRTVSIDLQPDNDVPKLGNVVTEHSSNGTGYLGPGKNTIVAVINETGSGFYGNNVVISAGKDYSTACIPAGEQWLCAAYNITASSSITVGVRGGDDAGNMFAGSKKLDYDNQKPSILNVTLYNLASGNPFFLIGDDMNVKAYIYDYAGMKDDLGRFEAYGKFSGFASSIPIKADDCIAVDAHAWKCEWNLLNIVDGDVTAGFNLSDIVGNKDTSTWTHPLREFYIQYGDITQNYHLPLSEVSIYEQETNESPDYWEATVEGAYPPILDSETTMIIGHDVWFKVSLSPRTAVSLVSVSFSTTDCSGEDFDDYVDEANSFLVNPLINSTEQWVKMAIKTGRIKRNKLEFDCALQITSLHNGKISELERENITLEVKVEKVKEIANSVLDEIKSVRDGWLVKMGDWMSQLAKFFELATQMCNMIGALTAMLAALGLMNQATAPLEGTAGDPVARSTDMAAGGAEVVQKSSRIVLDKFCAIVTCRLLNCDATAKNSKSPGGSPPAPGSSGKTLCEKFNEKSLVGSDKKSLTEGWCSDDKPLGKAFAGGEKIGDAIKNKDCKKGECSTKCDKEGGFDANACNNCVEDCKKKKGEKDQAQECAAALWPDTKSSLILSLIFLCVPGIIYNLNKMSEIECWYLVCLQEYVPRGVPIIACSKTRDYMWCMFVFGQIFSLIPFLSFLKNFMRMVMDMLANPLDLLISIIFKRICMLGPHAVIRAACRLLTAYDAYTDLKEMIDAMSENEDFFSFDKVICKRALEFELPEGGNGGGGEHRPRANATTNTSGLV